MIPLIEPRVQLPSEEEQEAFDKIARRIGLNGYVILGRKFSKKDSVKDGSRNSLQHYSRFEFKGEKVGKVRDGLPRVRKNYEIISVKTREPKVAQWVVKDNRVDIVSIPISKLKEIITRPLANVASDNRTFFEIDLGELLEGRANHRSVIIRMIARAVNILLLEDTPFIFTLDVRDKLDFRDKRGIFALGKMLGIPDLQMKKNYQAFHERLLRNRKRLLGDFKAPGIWKVKEENIEIEVTTGESEEEISLLDLPKILEDYDLDKKTLERQRYLLFEIHKNTDQQFTERQFQSKFWDVFTKLFGEVGSSRAGVYLSKYAEEHAIGVIRCNNYSLDQVRGTLATMTKIDDAKVMIHVMKVSGTIKNLVRIVKKKTKEN